MSGWYFDEREVSERIRARWSAYQSSRPDQSLASIIHRQLQPSANRVGERLKLIGRSVGLAAAKLGREVIGLNSRRLGQVRREAAARHDVRQGQQLQSFDSVGQVGLHHQSPSSGRGIEPSAGENPLHRLSETPE